MGRTARSIARGFVLMEAYTDASIPRKARGLYPNYSNAFAACYFPESGDVIVKEIKADTDPNDCLPLNKYIDICEFAAIHFAVQSGASKIYSDSKNAIRMAQIIYSDLAIEWVRGHESLDVSSLKETLIRVPHVFAKKHQECECKIKVTLPVGRGWIETL